jgi:hypothetical protein
MEEAATGLLTPPPPQIQAHAQCSIDRCRRGRALTAKYFFSLANLQSTLQWTNK